MPNSSDEIDFVGPTLGAPTGGVPATPPHAAHHPAKHPPAHHPAPKADHPKLIFPLFQPPLDSYRTGGRYFGAPRTHRLHAACDLLNPYQAKIRAVADGVVIQSPYDFYLGTNALEIHHPGVGTIRYGEIDPHRTVHLKGGDQVRAGDVIAHVGRLDGTGASMLHFELYTGKGTGQLTVFSHQPYERRWDLVNPTSFVDTLLKHHFGHSS
jgi:murein DD-endopeptidase MepM/ murein hydrolase activator NlpD